MNTVFVRFLASGGGGNRRIQLLTTCVQADGTVPVPARDDAGNWDHARNALGELQTRFGEALLEGQPFPAGAAEILRQHLCWFEGYDLLQSLVRQGPVQVQLQFDQDTFPFMPEAIPLADGRWLDAATPLHRVLDISERSGFRRHADLSLAVIHADRDGRHPELDFRAAADRLQTAMYDAGMTRVGTYAGHRLLDGDRLGVLEEVFFRHRAVLFLGHFGAARAAGPGGWLMAPGRVLTMRDLDDFFRASAPRLARNRDLAVPDVVFANSCYSAGRDSDGVREGGLSYPMIFLQAGVRFFVGTAMDVVLGRGRTADDFRDVVRLSEAFLRRWAAAPPDAVRHLYEAKQELGFPAFTVLYQIYVNPKQADPGAKGPAPLGPAGAVLSGLRAGDWLGDYVLGEELWADAHGRTFRARRAGFDSDHLILALADQAAQNPAQARELPHALERLRSTALGGGHLVPDRFEQLPLRRARRAVDATGASAPVCEVAVLVYDRPAGGPELIPPGRPADPASRFAAAVGEVGTPDHPRRLWGLAADVAGLLAELHRRGLHHGNFGPDSVVLARGVGGGIRPLLKDAWVGLARSTRPADPDLLAPEELAGGVGGPPADVWALGRWLAASTGEPVAEPEGTAPLPAPTGIRGIVRGCLLPAPQLRPTAEALERDLRRATLDSTDGPAFAAEFHALATAGRRLFALLADDLRDAETALLDVASREHPRLVGPGTDPVRYRLFVAAEDSGLVDAQTRHVLQPWFTAAQIDGRLAARAASGLPPLVTPRDRSPPQVAAFNAGEILDRARVELTPARLGGATPLLMFRGNGWWDAGTPVRRILRGFQDSPAGPIVVVADDNRVSLETELHRRFTPIRVPLPSAAALYDHIRTFPAGSGEGRMTDATAATLTLTLYPCEFRDTDRLLRTAARRGGDLGQAVLGVRDEAGAARFRGLPGLTFLPAADLPPPEFVGLPAAVEDVVRVWVEVARPTAGPTPPPGFLIHSPPGCGKTELALSLGARLARPVIRLDITALLRGRPGETEAALRQTLAALSNPPAAVLLLDDLDRVFGVRGEGLGQVGTAGLQRALGDLLRWLDGRPTRLALVATARLPGVLPGECLQRVPLVRRLPDLIGDEMHPPELAREYRARVLAALLRRHRLAGQAADADLIARLTAGTDVSQRTSPLRSPLGRLRPGEPGRSIRLRTPAELAGWVAETILLHAGRSAPATREFWLAAVA